MSGLRTPFFGPPSRLLRAVCALAAALAASACQMFSPDGGMEVVRGITADAIHADAVALRTPEQEAAARFKVERLIRRPLSADMAVEIALLNNRGLQAAYNALGIAEAAMVEASLPPSPTASLQRISGSIEIEIERRIAASILSLATLPARAKIAAARFRQEQLRAANETLRVAAQTRRAYYRSVAARDLVGFLAQAVATAESASALARRLGESGALNKLDQAREQVFYAEMSAQLAQARQQADSERERLVRAMGLWGSDLTFQLPRTLPRLPRKPRYLAGVEAQAVLRRLDLQIARLELDALAQSYGLVQATRFLNLLDLSGVSRTTTERSTGERIRDIGVATEIQIPLFDFGEVRVRQAEQTYMQSVNLLTERAVNVRSQARAAYQAYRAAYDIAAHYRNEVLPLRKIISDETQLRYNAMMIDVFGLLTEARARIASITAAIGAQRAFWLAAVDLDAAITGGGVSGGDGEASPANVMPATADNH
jgi:outer membrane protein TolC